MKKRSRVGRLARFVLRGGRRRVGPADAPAHRPSHVLFDFDGTLADTFEAGREVLNELAVEFGFRPLEEAEVAVARDFSTRELMRHLGVPRLRLPAISSRGAAKMRDRMAGIQPFPGIREMLLRLRAGDFRLGIVTSNSEENVQIFLKAQDLGSFDFIESSSKLLGKASVLRRVLRERKLGRDRVFFVGDELRDIEAAHEVGIPIAAVAWGFNSERVLRAAQPCLCFQQPAAVADFLTRLPLSPC